MPHRSRRAPHTRHYRPTFRPAVQLLEDRCLLAAPVLGSLNVPLNLPAGKTLIVPLAADDPDGGAVSYDITSDNPQVQVVRHPSDTYLKLSVAGFGDLEF